MEDVRPSDLITAVLRGDAALDSLGPSGLADVAMPVHMEACRILALPQGDRRAQIEAHPLAELLAAEVMRMWTFRRTVNTSPP